MEPSLSATYPADHHLPIAPLALAFGPFPTHSGIPYLGGAEEWGCRVASGVPKWQHGLLSFARSHSGTPPFLLSDVCTPQTCGLPPPPSSAGGSP